MQALRSYPKVYNLGHHAIVSLLDGDVVVEEKVDGSQFSFGVDADGVLHMRSRKTAIDVNDIPKLFAPAAETVLALYTQGFLPPGWTYRGETLAKPKHNTLVYNRVPYGNVIMFDVDGGMEDFLNPDERATEAFRLGLESVPVFMQGRLADRDTLVAMLDKESVLGGPCIEGVAIKAYGRFGEDGKTLMGKHVSEAFKETHNKDWKARNPNRTDVVEKIIETLRNPVRWEKAIQHLRERGELLDSPVDIGPLLKEINQDVLAEEKDFICKQLFEWAWKKGGIAKGLTRGFPEWYKERLMARQFGEDTCDDS